MPTEIEILDTTLRDGSYAIDFQFTAEDTALIASALESAGIGLIEIAHGLGLGAARSGKGDQAATDEAYLMAAAGVLRRARFGVFFIPGIGNADDLRLAAGCGAGFVRIGTNVTELDRAKSFVDLAKKLNLQVSCNLMKSYAVPPDEFGRQARIAADFGADIVCLVDSAGGMLPEEVKVYITSARALCSVDLGFHGHDNLSMAVANTIAASESGATILDATLSGIGRSDGNTGTEVLAAILQKRGLVPNVDVNGLLDAAEAFVSPLLQHRLRSALGITTGRARFHSSFLGRVIHAARHYGVDVRELILRVGERNQIDAPYELLESISAELAAEQPRARVRVDIASGEAQMPVGFEAETIARVQELKEKSRKLSLHSVLNVVVTPYELTRVSPFVETHFGCAISNIMLADPALLTSVLKTADPFVDYILLDAGGEVIPEHVLDCAQLLTYSDHEMWARATVAHLTALLKTSLRNMIFAITGVPPLALRAATALDEGGARVYLDSRLEQEARALASLGYRISSAPLEETARTADVVISLSPRRPAVSAACVNGMRPSAWLYDGGIGSLEGDAIRAAEVRGVRVVRVDMRPSLSATALELIGMQHIVKEHMGRDTWDGVSVVAGGFIGREGEVIVDSMLHPARVIGIADGKGGILRAVSTDPEVLRVRRVIAQKLLDGR